MYIDKTTVIICQMHYNIFQYLAKIKYHILMNDLTKLIVVPEINKKEILFCVVFVSFAINFLC